jgi:RHS repeat-associated protein
LTGSTNYSESASLDGVCHVTETAIADPESPSAPVKTDTSYDGFGRVWKVSNPYRSPSDPTYGLTTYAYDPLGRVTSISYPDGGATTTSYSGSSSTVTDAALKKRTFLSDALGRLTSVTEDPGPGHLNYSTAYSYNALDDLLTVSQSGQSRSFTYDSFSHLITATNPESGQIAYTYDADGNVLTKQDARGTTTYAYDALNRVLSKNYSDTSTARACYAYDGLGWAGSGDTMTNAVGHLTASWSVQHDGTVVGANESYQFDPMGRLQKGRQCTPATCGLTSYPLQTGYDLMGNEINLWESSVARYSPYDAADRLSSLSASFNVSPPPLTSTGPGSQALMNITAHSPFGGLANAALGNGLAETRNYTKRGWLGSAAVGSAYSLSLGYDGNGNVLNANDCANGVCVNGNWTYTYDGVNRLQTAVWPTQASFAYSYGPMNGAFGNMSCVQNIQGGQPCSPALTFDPATNRIAADGIHVYDNGVAGGPGNLTADGTHGYVYDLENRITCVLGTDGTCTSPSAMLYFYDPQGQRVGKQQGDALEDYVYDPQGHITSVHDGSANLLRSELYSPDGRHVATWGPNPNGQYSDPYPSGLFWNHADWLGTERMRTDINGNPYESCTDTPYGMSLSCVSNQGDTSPMHFTGKQRDWESGLDNFGARYLGAGNNLGRFMTSDPLMASGHARNPQTWNRYAYALNNPLRFVDPDGMEVPADCAKDKNCQITVKVNVIYDKTVNNGKGLTKEQKATFEKDQLAKAQKDFGKSNIKLQFSYTQGSYTQDDDGMVHVAGIKSDSLNVIASNTTPTLDSGASTMTSSGIALTFINVNTAGSANWIFDSNTTEHELAHQFLGDTTRGADYGHNFIRDIEIDSRNTLQGWGASQSTYREGLEPRTYASPTNPEANKPQQ